MKPKISAPKTYRFNFLGNTYRIRLNTFFGRFLLEKYTETGFKGIWWPNKKNYCKKNGFKLVNGKIVGRL